MEDFVIKSFLLRVIKEGHTAGSTGYCRSYMEDMIFFDKVILGRHFMDLGCKYFIVYSKFYFKRIQKSKHINVILKSVA